MVVARAGDTTRPQTAKITARTATDRSDLLAVLEDDGAKVFGKTAIPRGKYRLITSESPRFGRILPEVLHVPGFTGIRIHGGNTAEDSHGCILVGQTQGYKSLGSSRKAFDALYPKILAAWSRQEDIWIKLNSTEE